jgi:PAS domain S-box-containing protein
LEVNLKSLKIRKELNDIDGYTRSLNNTGDTYIKLGQFEKAMPFLLECLEKMPPENIRLLSVAQSNLGEAYYSMVDYLNASHWFKCAVESAEKIEFNSIRFISLMHLGMIEMKADNLEFAKDFFDRAAFFLGEKETSLDEEAMYNRVLGTYFEKIGDFKKAVEYFKQFYFIEEKIKTAKQEKEIKSIQFATEINELKLQKNSLEKMVAERTLKLENTLQELTAHEEFNRKILNSSHHAIVVFNSKGQVVEFNPAAEKLFLIRQNDYLSSFLFFSDESNFDKILFHLFTPKNNELLKFRFDMTSKRGDDQLFLDVSLTQIDHGAEHRGIAFINDVTYRVLAERERKNELDTEISINLFAQNLFKANSVNEVLWGVAKDCIAKLSFEDCVIYLVDEEDKMLIQKAAHGPKNPIDFDIHNPITIPIGKGIVGTVAKTGIAEIISDTSIDDRYILDDNMRLSEIAVPIKLNDEVIGVIDSEHSEKNFYTERHLRILNTISKLVANRIDKLREQEEKEKLQEDIIEINRTLEEQVRIKTKENVLLNQEIQEKEKSLMLGEMASLLAHEMNTPLANIKNASIALLDNHKEKIQILLNEIDPEFNISGEMAEVLKMPFELLNSKELRSRMTIILKIIDEQEYHNLKNSVQILAKLNMLEIRILGKLNNINCIEDCLQKLYSLYQSNTFVSIINDGVFKVGQVVQEVQSLQSKIQEELKENILILNSINMVFSQSRIRYSIDRGDGSFLNSKIYGIQTKLIQLWNGIHRIVEDHSVFSESSELVIEYKEFENKKTVVLEYRKLKFDQSVFNDKTDFNSYFDFDHSMKVRMSFIKTILEDHHARLFVSTAKGHLNFCVEFRNVNY